MISSSSSSSLYFNNLLHEKFEYHLKLYQNNETKENFKELLSIVLENGYAIDFEMKGGTTLLYHSVSLNLEKETILILNCGARILKNNQNKSPIDVALERGNQVILQLLRRSSDYYNYLKSKNNSNHGNRVLSASSDISENIIYGVCKYAWSPNYHLISSNEPTIWGPTFRLSDIYEDYLDWNDRKLVERLQVMIDNLRSTENKFQSELELASKRKDSTLVQLHQLSKDLKNKEHKYCMQIWGTVEKERETRKSLEKISYKLLELKKELTEAYKKVYFFGEGNMRYFNGFVVKRSKLVNIRLTGSILQLGYVSNDSKSSFNQQKPRSRLIPIDSIDQIEISLTADSVSLIKTIDNNNNNNNSHNNGRTQSIPRASFTMRESNDPRDSNTSNYNNSSKDKVYFIFHFRNTTSSPTSSSSVTASSSSSFISGSNVINQNEGDGKIHLSPVLAIPIKTPPPTHPIVLAIDDTWGEIITTPRGSTMKTNTPPIKKELGLFARAKAKFSGKSPTNSNDINSTNSSNNNNNNNNNSNNISNIPMNIYKHKSMAHEFFEALQTTSMPDTTILGSEIFLNRNIRESEVFRRSTSSINSGELILSPSSPTTPTINEIRDGPEWTHSSISTNAQTSLASGLTSVESILSNSHRTSLASYQTSRSSQSGIRPSFFGSDRDSIQSNSINITSFSSSSLSTSISSLNNNNNNNNNTTNNIDGSNSLVLSSTTSSTLSFSSSSTSDNQLSKSLPKSMFTQLNESENTLPEKSFLKSKSFYGSRTTILLGRVAEEREDRSTSNDSSSLSHGSNQMLGLGLLNEHFPDSSLKLGRHQEEDGDEEDQSDWKSVGSNHENNENNQEDHSRDNNIMENKTNVNILTPTTNSTIITSSNITTPLNNNNNNNNNHDYSLDSMDNLVSITMDDYEPDGEVEYDYGDIIKNNTPIINNNINNNYSTSTVINQNIEISNSKPSLLTLSLQGSSTPPSSCSSPSTTIKKSLILNDNLHISTSKKLTTSYNLTGHSISNINNVNNNNDTISKTSIESYKCPTTNYVPSVLEGYGPIQITPSSSSPYYKSSNEFIHPNNNNNNNSNNSNNLNNDLNLESINLEQINLEKVSTTNNTSIPLPIITNDSKEITTIEPQLSCSFPMDSLLRHVARSDTTTTTSFSIFGESLCAESVKDEDYLISETSIGKKYDPISTHIPSLMPPRSITVNFKLPDDIESDEINSRLSTCSLPTLSRSVTDGREQSFRIGKSFNQELNENNSYRNRNRNSHNINITINQKTSEPRHIAYNLNFKLNATREERNTLESNLISCISERENLLQVLHYLQSLRGAIKHPPSAPSGRIQSSRSNIEKMNRKAFSVLSLIRNNHLESTNAINSGNGNNYGNGNGGGNYNDVFTDSFSTLPEQNIAQLSALLSAAVSDGLGGYNPDGTDIRSRGDSYDNHDNDSSRLSASTNPPEHDKNISEVEEYVYNLLNTTLGINSSEEKTQNQQSNVHNLLSSSSSSLSSPSSLQHQQPQQQKSEPIITLSLAQQIGPPPPLVSKEYERARTTLEELWHYDLIIFETVEKLAQCLLIREQTWQRLRKLQAQESIVVTPKAYDLYDIDLFS